MEIALGALLGAIVTASLYAGSRFIRSERGVLSGEGRAVRTALHAATATLPHLRSGLSPETAAKAVGHLRDLTQGETVALADRGVLLAVDGAAGAEPQPGDAIEALFEEGPDDRLHIEPRLEREAPGRGPAVVAPLVVGDERVGSLAVLYPVAHRIRPEDTRVVGDAASLVAAQVELAELEEKDARLARAELTALRAQISPHFVYNALAAVASYIHTNPDEARELLTEFAEFTRYSFGRDRAYVTLADELHYVEKYVRLERARFGDRLEVRLEVAPEVLGAPVPVLSLQPLVENAIRHGIESGSGGRIEILGTDLGVDAGIRVRDDGAGMDPEEARAALDGDARGIGLSNVHRRLQSSFGEEYGLSIETGPAGGTEVALIVPKFHPGVRAA